jgi:hypothetical protein
LVLTELDIPFKFVAHTKVRFDGECASFIYTADPISVQVFLAGPGQERAGMEESWNPEIPDDKILIKAF